MIGHQPFDRFKSLLAPDDDRKAPAQDRSRRILVVEDEYFIALEVEQWLTDAGHEVVAVAASADQAVAFAIEKRPELAIMDIRILGERDGVDAAREIFQRTGIRNLFASAHVDDAVRRRAAASRPLGWLEKPYTQEEFLNALAAAIAQLNNGGAH